MIASKQARTKTDIVALWAAPRCVSTAFEKAFSQRSDTVIVHEPFCDVYYFSQWRLSERFGDCEELKDYSGLQAQAKVVPQRNRLVFVKEHAYLALPYINPQVLADITNTLIIRDPREAMASWYRAGAYPTEEEFGFTALERLWQIVIEELQQPLAVVEANHFRSNPHDVLQRYCRYIKVDYDPAMLTWQPGTLRNWNARETKFHAQWHGTLDRSQGIMPPASSTVTIRPQEQEIMARAMEIYQKISALAI